MRIESPPASGIAGIALRQIERRDRQDWYDYLCLPEVYEPTSWNLESPDDLNALFDTYEATSRTSPRRLAVVDQTTDRLIGTIGFHTISDVNRSAEIAYDIAPAHWGRGLATRLCEVISAWSFEAYGFVRVQATVLVGNKRSERVLRRCGFQHEGVLRAFRTVRGRPGDFHMYARLVTDITRVDTTQPSDRP
jgi:RimJ/RimL family protein N-acetyltransferase